MGTLMAVSTLPGVLVSPFAGVLIDRYNRKRLLIIMDAVRGACVVLLAAAAYNGLIAVWMVFAAGILLSVCGAFFSPGVQSAVPDLVPKSKITNANSVFSIVGAGSTMLGNVAGGFLFQLFGAPLLFLYNGLSFLFSGSSICFVKIPAGIRREKQHFFKDMADGFHFMWTQKGLRTILMLAAVINFFSFIGIVLFLPLFQSTPSLGAGKYGIAMACFMAGAMAGFLCLSIVSVKPVNKLKLYIISNIIFDLSIVVAVNQSLFFVMVIFMVVTGFFNSVVNVLLISTVQVSTPQEMRGKVMAFMNMTTQGLTPFAMALGGVLGGFISLRIVISGAFLAVFIITMPSYFSRSFKKFISDDHEEKAPEI
jgi:DHA3 family macrolide efflux protein-like MFS transporter